MPALESKADGKTATACVIWLAVQMAALCLSAFRFNFWMRSPSAAEQFALCVIFIAQAGAAALLFPLLLKSARSALFVIATAWPLALLGAFLADSQMSEWAIAEGYLTVWLAALYVINRLLNTEPARLLGVSIAALYALGGPLLVYLRNDFGDPASHRLPADGYLGPIMGGLSLINPLHPTFGAWIAILGPLAGGMAWISVRHLAKKKSLPRQS